MWLWKIDFDFVSVEFSLGSIKIFPRKYKNVKKITNVKANALKNEEP